MAGSALLPFIRAHPDFELVAAAEPVRAVRDRFAGQGLELFGDIEPMLRAGSLDVVYVASTTPLHHDHTIAALSSGHHVIVEKPMAVSLGQARAMVSAAERADRILLVGHSHSYEAPIRAMRRIVREGALGPMRSISALYYSDWMLRGRRPEELDPAQGGSVPLRQGAHQIDIVRYIGGGLLRSVRGRVSRERSGERGEGAYAAYLEFADGTPATLAYNGYGHFATTELTFGIDEAGRQPVGPERSSRRAGLLQHGEHQPFFGLVLLSCEDGDVRVSPDGLYVYREGDVEAVSLRGEMRGRATMLSELAAAVGGEGAALHDGAWGLANLEASLALRESSATRTEVRLHEQVQLADSPAREPV